LVISASNDVKGEEVDRSTPIERVPEKISMIEIKTTAVENFTHMDRYNLLINVGEI
jgi:hypothetical protein